MYIKNILVFFVGCVVVPRMQTGKPACCRIQTGGKRQRTDDGAGAGAGAGTRGILVQNLTPTRL